MTNIQMLVTVLTLAAGVQLTRWLPFWLFPDGKEPPAVVHYLGRVLPCATMGLLVVYCLKGVPFGAFSDGARQLAAAAVVVALHLARRNTLLSIAGGTAVYMILIRI